ncbi:hypothetical protein Hanom_Chr17g01581011 [Helianthus anomalus]
MIYHQSTFCCRSTSAKQLTHCIAFTTTNQPPSALMDPSKPIIKLRKMENGNHRHYRLQQKHEDYNLEVLYQLGCFCVLVF